MYLTDIATALAHSELPIIVRTHSVPARTLWTGPAKNLCEWSNVAGWIVIELLVDNDDESRSHLPVYSKRRIITVV